VVRVGAGVVVVGVVAAGLAWGWVGRVARHRRAVAGSDLVARLVGREVWQRHTDHGDWAC